MIKTDGTVATYSARTGAGIVEDSEGNEYLFNYTAFDSDKIKEGAEVTLISDGYETRVFVKENK